MSFHIPGLLSVWETWGEIAERFIKVKGDPNRFQVWINTALGETWVEHGEAPDWERLYERREDYTIGTVPEGGVVLTAGADVQRDRIECEIVAWGRGRQSWSIDYHVFEGDTADLNGPAWRGLQSMLDTVWLSQHGSQLRIELMGVDEGYETQTVRQWVLRQKTKRVMACKGQDRSATPVWYRREHKSAPGGRKRGGVWNVGVSILKVELYRWLQMPRPTDEGLAKGETWPDGYCHFPEYGEDYFKQLTAEQLVEKKDRLGFSKPEWRKMRERNEALDVRILARAASIRVGIDRWSDRQWAELEDSLRGDAEPSPVSTQETTARRSGSRRRSGPSRSRFMGDM